jgi:leucyl aminopeptidase (aminopeptidase T)
MFDFFERSKGAKIVLEECFGVRPGMEVLIVTDTKMLHTGEILARMAKVAGAEVVTAIMSPRKRDGEEPPKSIASAIKGSDLCIYATQYILGHTKANKDAVAAGVVTAIISEGREERLDEFNTTLNDLKKMEETNNIIMNALKGADKVRVTTPSGSDIAFSVKGRTPLSLGPRYPKNLDKFNEDFKFPDWMGFAEAPIAPVKGSANGVYVVDAYMQSVGGIKELITWKVKEGEVIEVSGGEEAGRLKELIRGADENATNIAEFSLGTNHVISKVLRRNSFDKVILGTVHIGIGTNVGTLQAETRSDLHVDGVSRNPTVIVDGKTIMENGELLI